MSLPLNTILPDPVVSAFLPPFDEAYDPLVEATLGGTAIGDGSAGRQVQRWLVFYEAGVIGVADEGGTTRFTLAVAGVTTVSLAFDGNMNVAIAYQKANGSHLYYFDSILGSYNTFSVLGATSCRACVDDYRTFNAAQSDVLFSYVLDGAVYYRQQRDRYLTPRLIGASDQTLLRAGPNIHQRVQWKLGNYIPPF